MHKLFLDFVSYIIHNSFAKRSFSSHTYNTDKKMNPENKAATTKIHVNETIEQKNSFLLSNQPSNRVDACRTKIVLQTKTKMIQNRSVKFRPTLSRLRDSRNDDDRSREIQCSGHLDADDEDEEIGQIGFSDRKNRKKLGFLALDRLLSKSARFEPWKSRTFKNVTNRTDTAIKNKKPSKTKNSWSTTGTFLYTEYTKHEQWILHKKLLDQLSPSREVVFGDRNKNKMSDKNEREPGISCSDEIVVDGSSSDRESCHQASSSENCYGS